MQYQNMEKIPGSHIGNIETHSIDTPRDANLEEIARYIEKISHSAQK